MTVGFFLFAAEPLDPRTSPGEEALCNARDDKLTAVSVAFVRFEIKMTSFNFSIISEKT
jgi:hypothetical protein